MRQTIRPRSLMGLVMVTAMLLTGGCAANKKTSDKDLNVVTRAELTAMLNDPRQAERLVLIDVRPARAFADGHIPGAMNRAVLDLRKDDPKLADAKAIVVYGSGDPNDLVSWAAAKKLLALGYVNVHDLRGGMQEWLGQREFQKPLIDKRMDEKADYH